MNEQPTTSASDATADQGPDVVQPANQQHSPEAGQHTTSTAQRFASRINIPILSRGQTLSNFMNRIRNDPLANFRTVRRTPAPAAVNGNAPRATVEPRLRTTERNPRDRLFYAIFVRLALAYVRLMPPQARRLLEFVILVKAILCFAVLSYMHMSFGGGRSGTCLDSVKDMWPKEAGVLRVLVPAQQAYEFVEQHQDMLNRLTEYRHLHSEVPFHNAICIEPHSTFYSPSHILKHGDIYHELKIMDERQPALYNNITGNATFDPKAMFGLAQIDDTTGVTYVTSSDAAVVTLQRLAQAETLGQVEGWGEIQAMDFLKYTPFGYDEFEEEVLDAYDDTTTDEYVITPGYEYAVEYSLEYGLLRLSQETRIRLGVDVMTVVLDPRTDACFGDNLSRFILNEFLGYDDVLMASVKALAANESASNRGYLRDLMSGEHYRFVGASSPRLSYLIAALVLLIFTFATSMLLRFSHHQIFMFIIDLLQMFEMNMAVAFPAAPLLTVILALVGMEAIMSEFFNDTTTAFYIILIVWMGDQFHAVCCNTRMSKKYWLRFFFLYHYFFYAYHYRFNGMYSSLALITSWLFIQHSMLYFIHHYELPFIVHEYRIQRFLENGALFTASANAPAAIPNTPPVDTPSTTYRSDVPLPSMVSNIDRPADVNGPSSSEVSSDYTDRPNP